MGDIINIFDPVIRKIKKDLETGPLPASYLCSKYGVAVFLQLLSAMDDLKVVDSPEDNDKYVSLKKDEP